MEKKYLITAIILVIYILFAIISVFYLMAFNNGDKPNGGNTIQKGNNGVVVNIWINEDKFDVLRKNGIKYLFVDVGDTGGNGKLVTSIEEIEHFLEKVKNYEDEKNYDFVLFPYSEVNTYDYNFNRNFQDNLIDNYLNLVDRGFDGIYIDVEPIRDEEVYLEFLDRVKENFSLIGVYSGSVGSHSNNEWEWDLDFYEKVCSKVNLIFVPGYDAELDNKDEYSDYIERQVRELSNLGLNCDLILGVPTHSKSPETLENALESYSNVENNRFKGVAVFAEWTTSNAEWKTFEGYF